MPDRTMTDSDRLFWLMCECDIETLAGVEIDRHEFASAACLRRTGSDVEEPSDADEFQGFRDMIDCAMRAKDLRDARPEFNGTVRVASPLGRKHLWTFAGLDKHPERPYVRVTFNRSCRNRVGVATEEMGPPPDPPAAYPHLTQDLRKGDAAADGALHVVAPEGF